MASANSDFLDLSGKAVLITGAATGIGRAVAVGFASRSASVAIGDIYEEAARETLDLVTRAGGDVHICTDERVRRSRRAKSRRGNGRTLRPARLCVQQRIVTRRSPLPSSTRLNSTA